ncbi:FHA domain-containing protein [Aureimonas sp. ME7]|uniref:FHA domain-containing protein n=1 Tax=Aureimonas sp. ME7 TaxID=2744252 RepID=UPI0015F57A61|nr:FHA domain-containing protein [Aureimonas sp. ME7]
MRLRLVAQTPMPDTDKGWRLLERGELTLGRDPSCGWVLPDPARTVSKIHCRLRRDATGFTVTDESTNGMSVDRQDLAQGQTARLRAGSLIAFCGQRFAVEITGEAEPDWQDPDARYALSDDAPSITAILSDVSPGGTTASGVLPGRGGEEDWLAGLAGTQGPSESLAPRASRPAIGWSEPIDMEITGGARLPEDWDTEAATATRAEHRVATSTRMRIPRPPGQEAERAAPIPSPDGPSAAEAFDAFFGAAGKGALPAGLGDGADPIRALAGAGETFRAQGAALAQITRLLCEFLDEFDVAQPGAGRLDELPELERALLDAVRALVTETDALDPDRLALQARVAEPGAGGSSLASRLALPGRAERALLEQYRRLYKGAEASSPRERFARRLGAPDREPADPATAEFVELSADRPRHGEME